jgi:RES domain-containing protein
MLLAAFGTGAKILGGDFNDVPDSPAVRAALDGKQEFREAFSECHPGESGLLFSTAAMALISCPIISACSAISPFVDACLAR